MSNPSKSQPATVIISQIVPPEHWDIYREKQEQLNARVKTFDGFVGSEVLPPQEGVQDAWVVIFRFTSPECLHDWLNSRQRLEIVDEMNGLFDEEPQMNILAEPPHDEIVTIVFSHRIKQGREAEYREWRRRILEAQKHFDGFISQESFDPVEGVTQEWVDMARFRNKESIDAWLASPERKALLKELEPLVERVDIKRVGTGLDGWFRSNSESPLVEAPPAWKQAMSVWFALYPTVMLLTYYFNPIFGNLNLATMMLIGNAVSVALLTWLIMPWVNKNLGFWLLPEKKSTALDLGVAFGLFALLLLMTWIFLQLSPAQY